METTPGKRVKMLRESKGFKSLTAFAEASGLKIGALSSIEADRSAPSFDTLATLQKAFPDVSLEWLVSGEGSMLKDGRSYAAVAHGKASGEARATVHPTVQPADKELAAGQTPGPYMHDADPVVQQLLIRLAEKDRIIERQQEDIDAWRDAFRKPLASAHAATPAEPRQEIAGFRTAAQVATSCKVIAMYPPVIELKEAA